MPRRHRPSATAPTAVSDRRLPSSPAEVEPTIERVALPGAPSPHLTGERLRVRASERVRDHITSFAPPAIGRRVVLDCAYLERTSQRVGPSLVHGYAITGHSAQGQTCDRAFVLVTSEASREWCYTALSRGRQANRIYAVVPEHERDEFAPSERRRREGRDVLADAFARSDAQTLASEVGRRRDPFDRGMDFGR